MAFNGRERQSIHKHYLPRRSGVHRIAAIAIFRALLTKSLQTSIDQNSKVALQNVIRRRFQAHRNLTSKTLVRAAFTKAYQALDILDAAAAGDSTSTSRILKFLAAASPAWKAPIPPRDPPKQRQSPTTWRHQKDEYGRVPDPSMRLLDETQTMLKRPLRTRDGLRRPPHLVLTSGVPFLRVTKQSPPALTRFLLSEVKLRRDSAKRFQELEDVGLRLAKLEDDWDRIVEDQLHGEALLAIEARLDNKAQSEDEIQLEDEVQLDDEVQPDNDVQLYDEIQVDEEIQTWTDYQNTWFWNTEQFGTKYLIKLLHIQSNERLEKFKLFYWVTEKEKELAAKEWLEIPEEKREAIAREREESRRQQMRKPKTSIGTESHE